VDAVSVAMEPTGAGVTFVVKVAVASFPSNI
jgi:hypothetical protein